MGNSEYDDRHNTHRYLSLADEALCELKGDGFLRYRRQFDAARTEKETTEGPLEIALGITSFCNLRCKMCYRSFLEDGPRAFMAVELLDQIADELRRLKVASVWLGSFTEPLIHPEIERIIKRLGKVGAEDYWLTTNGTLLNESIAKAAIDAGVTKLHVSLDAATPETYRTIRGYDLAKVESNIGDFLELRDKLGSKTPFLRVTFCEQPDNASEIDLFVKKWTGVADIVDTQKLTDYSKLTDDSFYAFDPTKSFLDCYYPFYQIAVTYEGRLWPCPSLVYDASEVRYFPDTSIQDYWNSKEMQDLREQIKEKCFTRCCKRCLYLRADNDG